MAKKQCWLLPCLSLMLLFPSPAKAESADCVPETMFFGVALDGYPITENRLANLQDEIGLSPGIVSFFLQWPPITDQTFSCFPEESLNAIWHTGAIPCLTWEPMYYCKGREIMISGPDILNGAYDRYLLEFARQAALWEKPFMVRFAHEMNVARYHWGTKKSDYGPESPRIYKRLFRYVVRLFQKAGARNALWVFCPNAESVPSTAYDPSASWNRLEDYYPGDKYVDILGIDGYNWGTTQTKAKNGWDSRWMSFAAIFQPAIKTLRRLAPGKPILVFETACVDQGGDKGLWIRNAFDTAEMWKLNGLVWFQVKKENDWRINRDGAIAYEGKMKTGGCSPHQWIGGLVK